MYRKIYECDRCGKEMTERKKIILQEYSLKNNYYKTWNNIENKDVCEDCVQSFIDWLEHDC